MPKSPTARTLFIERMKREGGTPTPPPGRRARKIHRGHIRPAYQITTRCAWL